MPIKDPVRRKDTQRAYYLRNRDRLLAQKVSFRAQGGEEGKASRRAWRIANKYGISIEQVRALMLAQGNRCAICGKSLEGSWPKGPVIDHDHEQGAVRGILCGNCNLGLGGFGDNRATLLAAIAYLTDPPARRALGIGSVQLKLVGE